MQMTNGNEEEGEPLIYSGTKLPISDQYTISLHPITTQYHYVQSLNPITTPYQSLVHY